MTDIEDIKDVRVCTFTDKVFDKIDITAKRGSWGPCGGVFDSATYGVKKLPEV